MMLQNKMNIVKLFLIPVAICQQCVQHDATFKSMGKRTCVVGAGVAGLCAARHLAAAGQQVSVLEATEHVGGTWRYEPRVGTDEFGLPVLTSMYKYLRTNLPKQTMELPGFPMPEDTPSYPSASLYYEYLKSFANHFKLEKYIKFHHEVTLMSRVEDRWKVKYRNLITGEEFEDHYDYVIIGNGHHSKPRLPNIPLEKLFKGTIIHSHDYRDPERYRDRRVLMVGAGPSAMDIGLLIAENCSRLIHSHHSPVKFRTPFPSNYVEKPDIQEFTAHGVKFKDGSFEEIDDVVYCTGFEYSYPFLDETSGLDLQPNSVTPLYQHIVNIYQPTMLLIGLVVRACLVVAIDAQARYVAALVSGNFSLPPQERMLQEWQRRADDLRARGRRLRDIHLLWHEEDDYYANLTAESGIARVPPVMAAIRNADTETKLANLYTYRYYIYTVLDERTFTRVYRPPLSPSSTRRHAGSAATNAVSGVSNVISGASNVASGGATVVPGPSTVVYGAD